MCYYNLKLYLQKHRNFGYSVFFISITTSDGSAREHEASTALMIAVGIGQAACVSVPSDSRKIEEVPNGAKISFIASTLLIFSARFITAGHSDSIVTCEFIISADSALITLFNPHTPGFTLTSITSNSLPFLYSKNTIKDNTIRHLGQALSIVEKPAEPAAAAVIR